MSQLTIRMSQGEMEWLKKVAEDEGLSCQQWLRSRIIESMSPGYLRKIGVKHEQGRPIEGPPVAGRK